jgi:hypothetical protein
MEFSVTANNELKKKEDARDDPAPLTSPRNLFLITIGLVAYSALQGCINAFNGLVDWSSHPDMTTVTAVVQSLKPALLLGTIRGVILASMAVTVIGVGPQVWKVIGPVLGAATRNSLRFVSAFSRAVRSTGSFDSKDPLASDPSPTKPES